MTRIPDKRASMPPKKDWFLGKLKYRNTLPEIPFEPKSLSLSYDPARFTKFTPTSLEQTQKRELRSELMLGIPIDLVDVSALATKANASLDALAPEDRALMLSTVSESDPSRAARADRSSTAKVNVPFLRRSEYVAMSNNILGRPDDATYVERIRNPVRKLEYIAPEDQPALIEATFAAAKKDPVHPTKPSLTPVEVLPVFPDFDQWANRVVRVGFEAPPDLSKARAAVGMPDEELRGLQRENAFIVTKQHPMHKRQTLYYYCVPTEETLKRIAFDDDEDDQEEEKANEYEVVAEYMQFDRETKAQTFIFTLKQEEAVCYQEAPNRLRLQKRRRVRSEKDLYFVLTVIVDGCGRAAARKGACHAPRGERGGEKGAGREARAARGVGGDYFLLYIIHFSFFCVLLNTVMNRHRMEMRFY